MNEDKHWQLFILDRCKMRQRKDILSGNSTEIYLCVECDLDSKSSANEKKYWLTYREVVKIYSCTDNLQIDFVEKAINVSNTRDDLLASS